MEGSPGVGRVLPGLDGRVRGVLDSVRARIDAGDDRVVAIYRQRATGKGSGVSVEWLGGMVIELRDGRAIRTTNYPEPAEALEAAGLSE